MTSISYFNPRKDNFSEVCRHYGAGRTFLDDAEILDLVRTIEVQKAADRTANARLIEAAFAAIDAC
jgi:hypothetical protein